MLAFYFIKKCIFVFNMILYTLTNINYGSRIPLS